MLSARSQIGIDSDNVSRPSIYDMLLLYSTGDLVIILVIRRYAD